ncbi:transposase [Candidatus Sarmatiella mevalonica]|uniref:transposase n=1 Tax=Candidatus Sarmatiella mevalonica TaxID=2770581 RepID=UPI0019247F34
MSAKKFHKSKETKKLLEDEQHTLIYLPPYFPDLNPIEKKCAHAKLTRINFNCSIDALLQ